MDINIKNKLHIHRGMDLRLVQKVNCFDKNSIERALYLV